MQKLTAVILLTIKESYRKKVFAVLLIFTLALVSSSTFFPVMDISQKLQLVEIWSIRALSFFAALAAVFIAGTSIPSDIEERRIYNLVSKPLSKTIFFLGKYIGFTCVLGIFLIITGIVTLGYVRIVHLNIGKGDLPLQAKPRISSSGVSAPQRAVMKIADKTKYVLMGHNIVEWRFKELNSSYFDNDIVSEIKIDVYDERSASPSTGYEVIYTGYFNVTVVNPENSNTFQNRYYVRANVPVRVQFPRSLISSKGELLIRINPSESNTIATADINSVTLYGRNKSFDLNYIKGLFLIFLQSLIVLTASFMVSSFLSAPISILFGIFVLFCGYVYGFVEDSTRIADKAIENAKLHPKRKPMKGDIPVEVLEVSNVVSKNVLQVIPNFTKFDFSQYLLNNLAVPGSALYNSSLYAGIFIGVLLILGMLVIRTKDFS